MMRQGNIEREKLRKGFVISFTYPQTRQVWHGEIVHVGLGLAARNAIWVRALDGYNTGKIDMVLIEHVIGVISYV